MKLKKLSPISALLLAACVESGTTAVAKLSDNPVLSGGSYTTGGGITVAADIRERDGRTMVCGVWAESRHQSAQARGKASRVVSTGSVYLGSERIAQDLLFMRKVPPMASYGGLDAGCELTKRPWQAGDASRKPTIRIPRQLVSHDLGPSSGLTVYFKQGAPGAGQ